MYVIKHDSNAHYLLFWNPFCCVQPLATSSILFNFPTPFIAGISCFPVAPKTGKSEGFLDIFGYVVSLPWFGQRAIPVVVTRFYGQLLTRQRLTGADHSRHRKEGVFGGV